MTGPLRGPKQEETVEYWDWKEDLKYDPWLFAPRRQWRCPENCLDSSRCPECSSPSPSEEEEATEEAAYPRWTVADDE